nr:MAG TPA: hypothetical protein [Caudoviricetes sp.]
MAISGISKCKSGIQQFPFIVQSLPLEQGQVAFDTVHQ